MSSPLTNLDDEQRLAAICLEGPVVIRAGAGTGKTRTITHRIAYGVQQGRFEPSATLAVTFTSRAAGELRSRLHTMGAGAVQVRTFHSAALRQLRFFYPQVFKKDFPRLISSKSHLVLDALAACALPTDRDNVRDTAAEIEWAKVNILSPEAYAASAVQRGRDTAQVARAYEAYLSILDQRNLIDFEDCLLYTLAMLTQYEDIATQVQRQYKAFTVDEFQDVSPVQYELLRAWVGQRNDVCVVGDPTQTIFSFTGAKPEHLERFTLDFPQAHGFELTHSYRSTPQIIHAANTISKPLPTSVQLKPTKNAGDEVAFRGFDSDESEAQAVANRIIELIGTGVPAGEIAVLMRIDAQSEPIEAALASAGVPYAVRGSARFFERGEVVVALSALRAAAAAPVDKPVVAQVVDALSGVGYTDTAPNSGPAHRATWESLRVIVDLAQNFDPQATMPDFVAHLAAQSDVEAEPSANAVTLATIHSAKGLEWDAVLVIGVSEGLLPVVYARTPDAVDEERRLLYVAMTRARKHLWVSWARGRGRSTRGASRFLEDLIS